MPVSHRGILWISSDEMIKWRQKSNPNSHPPNIFFPIMNLYIVLISKKLPTLIKPLIKPDNPRPLKLLLLGPVTCWAKFNLC